jgi:cation diffusion facilitator family transporter
MTHVPLTQSRSVLRWAAAALVVSISLMFIKLLAYGLTGSAAVLSDALESTIHIVTSGFALVSVGLAAQPRDSNHPYGHGKVEYLSAAVEGTLVAVAGVGILVIAVQRLRHP